MPEPQEANPPVPDHARLREAAQLLREAHHLGPEAQQELAALTEKLADALARGDLPPEEEERLARSAFDFIEALHQQHEQGLLAAARDRLEQALVAAEGRAPVTVGLVRQMLDVLAGIGI
jgi:hypothetical protein